MVIGWLFLLCCCLGCCLFSSLLDVLDPIEALMSAPMMAMVLSGMLVYRSAICWLKRSVSLSVYPEWEW